MPLVRRSKTAIDFGTRKARHKRRKVLFQVPGPTLERIGAARRQYHNDPRKRRIMNPQWSPAFVIPISGKSESCNRKAL
jgi:hypothetical protein